MDQIIETFDERKDKIVEKLSSEYSLNHISLEEYERLIEYSHKIETEQEFRILEKIIEESKSARTADYAGTVSNNIKKEYTTILSSRQTTGPVTNGNFVNILGSHQIILKEEDLINRETVFNVTVLLGSIEISVPNNVEVINNAVPLLANVSINENVGTGDAVKKLIINGSVILGSIDVKRKKENLLNRLKRFFFLIISLVLCISCHDKTSDIKGTVPAAETGREATEEDKVRDNNSNTIMPEETGMENMISYGMDDDLNFEKLLGYWYKLEHEMEESLYDFDENSGNFVITKNGDLYKIQFTGYDIFGTPFSYTSTGIIQREEVREADMKYFSKYKMSTSDGVYSFQIGYNSSSIFGKEINSCAFSYPNAHEPWSYIRKDELIRISIPYSMYNPLLFGFIKDSGVRIRENYGLSGNIIRTLKKGEQVKIIGVSPAIDIIDENFQHWYQVTTDDGTRGWVYGVYLGITGFLPDDDGGYLH